MLRGTTSIYRHVTANGLIRHSERNETTYAVLL